MSVSYKKLFKLMIDKDIKKLSVQIEDGENYG